MKKKHQLFRRATPEWVRFIIVSSLAIMLMFVDGSDKRLFVVRSAVQAVTVPIKSCYASVYNWGSDLWIRAYTVKRAILGNQKLIEEQAEQAAKIVQLSQVEVENQDLKNLLALKNTQTTPSKAAKVLYQVANPYQRKLVLDKGANDGISDGQPVISSGGLLGLITKTAASTSELTLVLDSKINIPVQVQRNPETRGFLSGKQDEGFLEVRFFRAQELLEVNDILVTSGLDGLYPNGIPVARVTDVSVADNEGRSEITVKSTTQGMSARYVLILQLENSIEALAHNHEQAQAILKDRLPTTLGARTRKQVQATREVNNAN